MLVPKDKAEEAKKVLEDDGWKFEGLPLVICPIPISNPFIQVDNEVVRCEGNNPVMFISHTILLIQRSIP